MSNNVACEIEMKNKPVFLLSKTTNSPSPEKRLNRLASHAGSNPFKGDGLSILKEVNLRRYLIRAWNVKPVFNATMLAKTEVIETGETDLKGPKNIRFKALSTVFQNVKMIEVEMPTNKIPYLFTLSLILLVLGCSSPVMADQNKIVTVAQSQLGLGEEGKDNHGKYVERYTKGKQVSWCAAFVSWTLERAGYRKDYLLSARSFYKNGGFKSIQKPRSGDIIVFYRGSRRSGLGHVGIIEQVRGSDITTIEGNVGKYPARVKRMHYNLQHIPNLIGFVRVK